MMRLLQVNACVYCGSPAQGHYKIHRDGVLNGSTLQVHLCDGCGSDPLPSLQDIWARIAMVDDAGHEWGPTVHACEQVARRTA